MNDFSGDPNCKALWSFESGALTVDSIGGNTLVVNATPAADTTNFKEKSGSVELLDADNDSFDITDAALDAGFPGKSGDGGDKWSVTYWLRMQGDFSGAGSLNHWIFLKSAFTQQSFGVGYNYNNAANEGRFIALIGTGIGSTSETWSHGTLISLAAHTNNWYHVGVTFDDSDKSFRIRVYDDNAGAILGSDATGNTAANWATREAAKCLIGSQDSEFTNVDHNIDELVIFNDILTQSEIDEIRQGIYGAAGGRQLVNRGGGIHSKLLVGRI